MLLTPITVLF
uniref:Uncharacterized protein n=1 Tax=Rhizophora mucronata TaxID=61149 RepID=A0A2P2P678_RHIMU